MENFLLLFALAAGLGACAVTRETPAPVVNVTAPAKSLNPTPAVAPAVAAAPAASTSPVKTTVNKINDDDDGVVVQNTSKKTASSSAKVVTKPVAAKTGGVVIAGVEWLRPVNGQIIQAYTSVAKGVDVAAPEGQAILAANDGKVVYSGNGLKGYGNLIIIKHADNFLTAYSHNKVNLVKEGSSVKRGQKIAEVGKTDSDKPLLHFELRKSGKPINPTVLFE